MYGYVGSTKIMLPSVLQSISRPFSIYGSTKMAVQRKIIHTYARAARIRMVTCLSNADALTIISICTCQAVSPGGDAARFKSIKKKEQSPKMDCSCLRSFWKHQKSIPGTFLMRSYTPKKLSTFFFHEEIWFWKIFLKIFQNSFSKNEISY